MGGSAKKGTYRPGGLKGAEVFLEVDGDLVHGGDGRRAFIGFEEGDEF